LKTVKACPDTIGGTRDSKARVGSVLERSQKGLNVGQEGKEGDFTILATGSGRECYHWSYRSWFGTMD